MLTVSFLIAIGYGVSDVFKRLPFALDSVLLNI